MQLVTEALREDGGSAGEIRMLECIEEVGCAEA